MKKATPRMILVSSVALFWSFPLIVRAQDRPVTPISDTAAQGIQVTAVEGKLVVRNAAPNPPLVPTPTPPAVVRQKPVKGMPGDIQSLVETISKTHGVDPRLVSAVMRVESNYNQFARSSKGALGLMQLIPATGKRFGVKDFFDPAQNIEGGVRYLKFLSDKFEQDLDLLLAGYNAGENAVERYGRRVPPIRETIDYVRKIRSIYKPENRATLVSATGDAPTAAAPAPPPPKLPSIIYSNVDERGVTHFSNMGPPN